MSWCRPLIFASIVAVAASSLLAAGCGRGGSPPVASGTSPTNAAAGATTAAGTTTVPIGSVAGALAFARCMRAHGIANWPDPTSDGAFDKSKLRQLGLSVARVRAIETRSCNYTFENGGSVPQPTDQQRLADMMSFATCIRNHGVTRFPDPTVQGGLTTGMVQAEGIDVHSPAFLRVVQACLPASHGLLTPAKVRAALANAQG